MTALPINIDELLKGHIVEWERLEFKKGWNPEEFIRTVTAFANDINNWGGGYLIFGIEEVNGQPIFPPKGLVPNQIDAIQKEILSLGYKIRPHYHPVVVPYCLQEKLILVIWCPGGQTRPYQTPESLGKNANYAYFIRRNSSTIKALTPDIQRLHETANQVPFDDRIHHQAQLSDLDISLIKDFLREVKSDLFLEVDKIPFTHLCRQMQIAQGPEEYLKPLNIGLMVFNSHPEHFFPAAQIDVVDFHDEAGDSFSEKIFKGPIQIQLKEVLRYLQSMLIKEEIRKRPNRAEADRFYNYPYVALEEAIANAVYHKDYAQREPIEISIHVDRIEILSFPGPLPPLKIEDLNQGAVRSRTYRNRRIGDFLKELHLTEGRCTGVPKIRKSMEANGSPPPIFKTDEARSFFLTILPIHPEATRKITINGEKLAEPGHKTHQIEPKTHQIEPKTHQIEPKTHQLEETFETRNLPEQLSKKLINIKKHSNYEDLKSIICELCSWKSLTAQQIADFIKRKDKKYLVRKYLTPLVKEGLLNYAYPEKGNSPNQSYTTQ
ncbi:MAG: ATP-dependent helicase [Chlamydiales bacterium]|jgi:ATP-dependent DNA helicase RecG|nr:ATP-dependent helicase [Chlamydiales bacterium]